MIVLIIYRSRIAYVCFVSEPVRVGVVNAQGTEFIFWAYLCVFVFLQIRQLAFSEHISICLCVFVYKARTIGVFYTYLCLFVCLFVYIDHEYLASGVRAMFGSSSQWTGSGSYEPTAWEASHIIRYCWWEAVQQSATVGIRQVWFKARWTGRPTPWALGCTQPPPTTRAEFIVIFRFCFLTALSGGPVSGCGQFII